MKNVSLFTLFFFLLSAFTMQAQNTLRLDSVELIMEYEKAAFTMQAQNTLRLNAGQRLDKGQKIEVAGKGYLILQNDGNLVAYDAANRAKWATGTYGKVVSHVIMQADGNLVIYFNSNPIWASNTGALAPNGYLKINLDTWEVFICTLYGTTIKNLRTGDLTTGDLTTGVLVSGPGPDTSNIKVIGLEEFRELHRDREVTFFCQAGYVSRFELSYDRNGEKKSFTTNNLPVGQSQSFKVPIDATNIVAKGFMLSAGVHSIFTEKLSAPADVCYKTYGTIFDRRWSKCN